MLMLLTAATLWDCRQGIDGYRANVSNLQRSNMISNRKACGGMFGL